MKKTFKYMIAIFAVIICICLSSIWTSYFYLETTHLEYTSSKLDKVVTFVILADLHDHEFGKGASKLVAEVKENQADVILMIGDMLNDTSEDSHVAVEMAEELAQIAPVYYALGNHEIAYMEKNGHQLLTELAEAGAVVLELDSDDIEVNGQRIRVGGMFDYAFAPDGNASTIPDNMVPEMYEYLTDFQDTNALKIMMAHRPDSFIFGDAPKTWDIDLVISAHDHGGQVILPLVGGLFGGDQGWFPDYVYGLHSFEQYDMLITRGLGSNPKLLPRLNNRPEVMVLTVGPEE